MSSFPPFFHAGREPPSVETCHLPPSSRSDRTWISDRPDSLDTCTSHRSSGEGTGIVSLNGVERNTEVSPVAKSSRRMSDPRPGTTKNREGRQLGDHRDTWMRACRRAKLPGKLVYDLRRSAVRNLERAGVPRSWAMKLTRHKTESAYRRYAIVSEADLGEGVRRLASFRERTPVKRRRGLSSGRASPRS